MAQPNMQEIMAQAQKMQQQMQEAQEEIANSSVTGSAGNDLVKVTMNGEGQVTDISIDPSIIDPDDPDTVQDLVLGAFQDAYANLQKLAQEKMGPLQQQLGGMGL